MIRKEALTALVGMVALMILTVSCSSSPKKNGMSAQAPSPTPSPALSTDKSAKSQSKEHAIKCAQDIDQRTLLIQLTDSGCELQYTKFGVMKVAAKSVKGREHCDQVQDRIRKHLETAGFTCK